MSVGELASRAAEAAKDRGAAPVIVLGYAGSGAERLRSVLSGFPGLGCTTGTGIVPLCERAVSAWQAVDGRAGGGLSPLAAASVRTLSSGLMTAILAREGGRRWCEFITAPPAAAAAFARLYPQARFLAVHRQAAAVTRVILDASRWGLAGSEFAPFVSAYPASTAAALAGYWVARTTQQLEFEREHPGSCLRVRIEDLAGGGAQAIQNITTFLSLSTQPRSCWLARDDDCAGPADPAAPAAGLPLSQIPAPLLAQLSDLHRTLGYPATAWSKAGHQA